MFAIIVTLFTPDDPIELSSRSFILPNPEDLGHIDFRYQKISEESNENKIKHIRSIPVDSAYFGLHLVFEVAPVPIATTL